MRKPCPRTTVAILRDTRALGAAAAVASVLLLGACSTGPLDPRTSARPDLAGVPEGIAGAFENVAFGDPTARVRALRALAAGSTTVRLRMTRTTVEGDPIKYYLIVEGGAARLIVDARLDRFGGGVTDDRFAELWLARVNQGDEPPTRVDPSGPLPAGTYVLQGLVCASGDSCLREF